MGSARLAGRLLGVLVLLLAPGACASRLDVDGARAQARVARQVAAGPRVPGTPGHDTVRDWLAAELARLGGRVERQDFADSILGRRMPLTNLIGRFGPESGPRLILCAHWDTRFASDQDPDSTHRADPVPGANDGASGVAVLLEVAELMRRRPPPLGVDLVFFDGEDQGSQGDMASWCRGAQHYAATLAPDRRPIAAFLFDMVGDRDLDIHPEVQSAERASNLVDLVLEGARATGARHFLPDPRFALTDDHIPLLEAGIPAVDIVDFDYPAWHTHRDLPDQTSPASLAEVARVAAWIVYRSPLSRAGR